MNATNTISIDLLPYNAFVVSVKRTHVCTCLVLVKFQSKALLKQSTTTQKIHYYLFKKKKENRKITLKQANRTGIRVTVPMWYLVILMVHQAFFVLIKKYILQILLILFYHYYYSEDQSFFVD